MDTDYEIGCGAQWGERELLREGRGQKSYGTREKWATGGGRGRERRSGGRERAKVKTFGLEIAPMRPRSLKANRNFTWAILNLVVQILSLVHFCVGVYQLLIECPPIHPHFRNSSSHSEHIFTDFYQNYLPPVDWPCKDQQLHPVQFSCLATLYAFI